MIRINGNVQKLKPSATVAMTDHARALCEQGIDVISLAGGEPDFATPAPIVEAGVRAIREGRTHYTPGRGILSLRERIARKMREENGVLCTAENILVTPGGKFALHLAITTLLEPGDGVLLLDPSWVSYAPMTLLAGGEPVRVPLSFETNYAITEALLEAHYRPNVRLLILNTPNNPTGRVLTPAEARAIEAFLLRHEDVLLLSDEVYEKLVFDGRTHISMGAFAHVAERVITVNGFSKCAAMTGWRVGWLCAPRPILNAMVLVYQHTQTCISEFSQIAAETALDCPREIERMRAAYERRRNLLTRRLRGLAKVRFLEPEGAFYAWCRIEHNGMDSDALTAYLLEEAHVAVVSGAGYGLGTEKCVRLCFAASDDALERAAERVLHALR